MLQQLRAATTLLFALTILTGIMYPGIVTAIAQMALSHQANGSVIRDGEEFVGSELIGQSFTRPEYLWGRLSATGAVPYNAAASSGSNYGPMHPALKEAAEGRIAALRRHGLEAVDVPVDLVTASGSGLDPHISPVAAEVQAPRIAAARSMTEVAVMNLVRRHTEGRQFGVLGEPRVNVVRLNQSLDMYLRTQKNGAAP